MEILLIIVFITTYFTQILRIVELKKRLSKVIVALLLGIVPLVMLPLAVDTNKSFLSAIFMDNTIFSLLKTAFLLEIFYFLWLNMREIKVEFGLVERKTWQMLPFGVIMLSGIYFMEVKLMLLGINTEFIILAGMLSLAVIVLLLGGSWLIKRILPQTLARTEFAFILNALMLILTIFII